METMETLSQAACAAQKTLLPIREAYEWKQINLLVPSESGKGGLLPIREAYEWKHSFRAHSSRSFFSYLLPIREAYEWKLDLELGLTAVLVLRFFLLPIREAYEWKPIGHPTPTAGRPAWVLLPIREAYEWKP